MSSIFFSVSSELRCELELLLLLGTVEVVSTTVLLRARQVRSLSGIIVMIGSHEAGLGEVRANLISGFTLLESNLDAALARAGAL